MNQLDPNRQVLIDAGFRDFELFRQSVAQWDLDFMLLSKGGFKCDINYSLVNQCLLGRVNLNCNLEQHGLAPEGMRTFVIPAKEDVSYKWRLHEVDGNSLQLFPENGELYSVSNGSFDCFVVSFPNALIGQVMTEIGFEPMQDWGQERVWYVSSDRANQLRFLARVYQSGYQDTENQLLKSLLYSLVRNEGTRVSAWDQNKIIRSTKEFIESDLSQSFKISDFTSMTEMSERSIQYAFKQYYGVSPLEYVKQRKLHAVYLALVREEAPVSAIAGRFGFWHMGQFAADFKRTFGCLPSQVSRDIN